MRILSVDGGGYLGLATAALIEGLEHHFSMRFADRFDMFCGTSTGALIALGLAAGKSGAEMKTLYTDLGDRVFRRRADAFAAHLPRPLRWTARVPQLWQPLYSAKPLQVALDGTFHNMTLADVHARGKLVIVPSFCVSTGEPRLFKTDHGGLSLHGGYRLSDIAMASAAAPTYFGLVRIKQPVGGAEEWFCDGGIVANQPALLGFAEAISQLQLPPSAIDLLSVSTPRADLSTPEPVKSERGLFAWRKTLVPAFIDGGAFISGQVLKRIIDSYPLPDRPRYLRIELENRHCLKFDDAGAAATQMLLQEGTNKASSGSLREQVGPFLV